MVLHETPRHGEAQARTALLAVGDEGLEDPLADAGCDARAVVGEHQHQLLAGPVRARDRRDPGREPEPARPAHRVARVGRDVRDRPPDLVDVDRAAAASGQLEVALDREARQLSFDPGRELGHQHPERHRAQHQRLGPAHEVERLAGHALEPVDRVHDRLRARLDLPGLDTPLHERFGPAPDERHRPPEVVDQHAGHRADRGETLRLDELLLVGEVLERERRAARDQRDDPRVGVGHRPPPVLHRAEHQHAGEAAPREQRHQHLVRSVGRGLDELPLRQQEAGARRGGARLGRPLPPQARGRVELEALEALEPAVPEQEARAVGGKRVAQVDRQQPREPREVRGLEHALGERRERGPAPRGQREDGHARSWFDTRKNPSL